VIFCGNHANQYIDPLVRYIKCRIYVMIDDYGLLQEGYKFPGSYESHENACCVMVCKEDESYCCGKTIGFS
jgi:hypothetical protein